MSRATTEILSIEVHADKLVVGTKLPYTFYNLHLCDIKNAPSDRALQVGDKIQFDAIGVTMTRTLYNVLVLP